MAFLLSIYLILHLVIGFLLPYRRGAKPYFFLLIEKAGAHLEHRLNRQARAPSVLFVRGFAVVLSAGIFALLAGYVIQRMAVNIPYGGVMEIFFLSLCISFTIPVKLARHVLLCLRRGELQAAAVALQPYLDIPSDKADSSAVIRRTVGFMAVSFNMFLGAPAFWFLAAGPAGLALYITCAALHAAFGMPDEKHRHFGRSIRFMDTAVNIVPAFLTALILSAAMLFVSKSNPLRAGALLFRRIRNSYTCWPMAAVAGGLGVTLEGFKSGNWIGVEGSSARLVPEDLVRAIMLQYVSFILVLGAALFLML